MVPALTQPSTNPNTQQGLLGLLLMEHSPPWPRWPTSTLPCTISGQADCENWQAGEPNSNPSNHRAESHIPLLGPTSLCENWDVALTPDQHIPPTWGEAMAGKQRPRRVMCVGGSEHVRPDIP